MLSFSDRISYDTNPSQFGERHASAWVFVASMESCSSSLSCRLAQHKKERISTARSQVCGPGDARLYAITERSELKESFKFRQLEELAKVRRCIFSISCRRVNGNSFLCPVEAPVTDPSV